MSDINAAIGLVQLEKLPQLLQRRREIGSSYDVAFAELADVRPLRHDLRNACPWAYVVKVAGDRRDAFREHLRRQGISTLVQFIPNHLQPAFAPFRTSLPVTEQVFREIVSLPLFVEMSDDDVSKVIGAVQSFVDADVPVAVSAG